MDRPRTVEMRVHEENEEAGLPVRAALHPDGLYLMLKPIGVKQLQDSFMQQTIARINAPASLLRAPLRKDFDAGSAPNGLIFHVGRCGSTLLSQLLKQSEGVAVYAEPMPLNELLAPPHKHAREEIVAALRGLGEAFARHSGGRYVLKCSSWATLYADIITEAFPQTPWAFSVRDPLEVGVSFLKEAAPWFRRETEQGREIARRADPANQASSHEQYFARLFAACCEAVLRLDRTRGRLIEYETLPAAVWESLAPHFGLPADAAVRAKMTAAAHVDVKAQTARPFAPDSGRKRAMASDELREAVDAIARPALARLRSPA